MALQSPVAVPQGRQFGSSILADYAYWHIGTESAMFGRYTGSVYSQHFHAGLDFPAAMGTAIVASETGVVKYAGWAAAGSAFDGGGYIVQIHIYGGMHVVSCHMNGLPIVRSGQQVYRGQRIGYVGHTGNAQGNHVHFACSTATASGATFFRNPHHYLPGGKYANSPLILPYHIPDTSTAKVVFAPYPADRHALIRGGATVKGYDPMRPGGPVKSYTAPAAGSSFWVNGKATVTWPGDSTPPVPKGTFLHGDLQNGGVFTNLLVVPSSVSAADHLAW